MSRLLDRLAGIAVAMLYTAGTAAADPADASARNRLEKPDSSIFSFSGFGTLGLVHSSEKNADFTSSAFKPDGAGFSHNWSADVDSLIAVQLSANFNSRLSAVVQIVSEQNHDKSYTPHVEWANVQYRFSPDFSVRVGQIVLATFMISDYRKVGFANTWVRPPIEVYGLLPVTKNTGVDASYLFRIGEVRHTLQVSYGGTQNNLPPSLGGGKSYFRRVFTVSDSAEYGALVLRASYQQGDLTIQPFNHFFDVFRQFGAQGNALADRYDQNARRLRLLGLGASYDPGNWFVTIEGGVIDLNSVLGKRSGWYAGGGYRFGKFTPYAIYARAKADNLSDPGLDASALPPFLAGAAAGLNGALNAILSAKPVQSTTSIGGRWDLMKNTAFKLQFDHTSNGAGSVGSLTNTQPGFQLGGKVNLFSATVDFVF